MKSPRAKRPMKSLPPGVLPPSAGGITILAEPPLDGDGVGVGETTGAPLVGGGG